jgi:2-polyprenyl-3-methyl-5-hydroxy-6-metoxy-1,4-benzoquinol methylase
MYEFATYRQLSAEVRRRPDCPTCGKTGASSAPATLAEIAETYEKEREHASFNSLLLDPLLAEILPPASPSARALDVGCGSGEVTRLLATRGYDVLGTDIEPAMLAIARARTTEPLVEYREAALDDLEASGTYDLVTCLNVLDWIEDFEAALGKLHDALKPGGKLVLSVPHPFKDTGVWRKDWNGERWVFEDFAVTGLYFSEGPIEKSRDDSAGNTVIAKTLTFKRTVETYVRALVSAGFRLDMLHEPAPMSVDAPVVLVEKASRVPYFLVMCATRGDS